jgi:regulator of replication initiation timing
MPDITGLAEKNQSADDPALIEHAAEIRRLDKKPSIADVIEMGRRLTVCKPRCGHGGFGPWLDREFGWAERTAQNFMRVYEVSKSANFADLDLPLSGLYLLTASSTPEVARDGIFERARAGEIILIAEIKRTIDTAKSRRQSRSQIPAFHRARKLGEDTIAKIKGTSLDNARELDELVILNRGAPEGELTPIVRQLVEAAAAGGAASAIDYTKSGAAFRRENIGSVNADLGDPDAENHWLKIENSKLRDENKRLRERLPKVRCMADMEAIDAVERLQARVDELENTVQRLTRENVALRHAAAEKSKIKGGFNWAEASLEERKRFLAGIDRLEFLVAIPKEWDLRNRMLRATPVQRLLTELERRLPADLWKKHQAALKAINRALDVPGQHVGPVLELTADPIADNDALH